MSETLALMSEGLKVMYRAFQNGVKFPGQMDQSVPHQDAKEISAHEILVQLGLINMVSTGRSLASASPTSPLLSSTSTLSPATPNDVLTSQWPDMADSGPPLLSKCLQESESSLPHSKPAVEDPTQSFQYLPINPQEQDILDNQFDILFEPLDDQMLLQHASQFPSQQTHSLV